MLKAACGRNGPEMVTRMAGEPVSARQRQRGVEDIGSSDFGEQMAMPGVALARRPWFPPGGGRRIAATSEHS
ncbi:MAG: hypothetical protein P8Z67_14235 [Gammaproteobacteria bacterium]